VKNNATKYVKMQCMWNRNSPNISICLLMSMQANTVRHPCLLWKTYFSIVFYAFPNIYYVYGPRFFPFRNTVKLPVYHTSFALTLRYQTADVDKKMRISVSMGQEMWIRRFTMSDKKRFWHVSDCQSINHKNLARFFLQNQQQAAGADSECSQCTR